MTKESIDDRVKKGKNLDGLVEKEKKPKKGVKIINGSGDDLDPYSPE